MKFCTNCGTPLPVVGSSCQSCGYVQQHKNTLNQENESVKDSISPVEFSQFSNKIVPKKTPPLFSEGNGDIAIAVASVLGIVALFLPWTPLRYISVTGRVDAFMLSEMADWFTSTGWPVLVPYMVFALFAATAIISAFFERIYVNFPNLKRLKYVPLIGGIVTLAFVAVVVFMAFSAIGFTFIGLLGPGFHLFVLSGLILFFNGRTFSKLKC